MTCPTVSSCRARAIGSTEKSDIADCYASGANSYVRKATDYDDLRRKMRQVYDFWMTVNERRDKA